MDSFMRSQTTWHKHRYRSYELDFLSLFKC
jgi:hypothetical protein